MTKDFLDLVLPDTGHRCIAFKSNGIWPHTFHSDNRRAAEEAATLDLTGTGEVYFACASFVDPTAGRKGVNVQAVRSFWLDIDTGEWKGKRTAAYADRLAALAALEQFCFRLALPPSVVISSGYGLHVYWSMDADLTPNEWRDTSKVWKRVCDKCELKADHSRTTDIASALRVPGTHNRKNPAYPQQVKVLSLDKPISHAEFRAKLTAYLGEVPRSIDAKDAGVGIGSNTDIAFTYPPSDAHLIAEQCAVIRHIRDTRGNVDEPLWHAGLGVLVHTVQADDIGHEWSSGHPYYDFAETQAKIDRLKAYGPTTCERLDSLSNGLCKGCHHREGA
jgi:hypothetical protein